MRFDRQIDVQYATSGGTQIAYQVVGDSPLDLLYVPGYISNLELAWEDRGYTRLLDSLSSFSRLIAMDKRGTGLSDRGITEQVVEDHVRDIGAVLDGAGSERAAILGAHEGGAAALLYAAANPDRVSAVVSYSARARCLAADDYPHGWPREIVDGWIATVRQIWGRTSISDQESRAALALWSPSRATDMVLLSDLARFLRLSAGPTEALAILRMYIELDIRAVLQSVRVPVLVLNRQGDVINPPAHAEYLAEHLPNGTLQVLPGDELPIWWGDVDALVHAVQAFLTGSDPPEERERILATVLFTDFVGSAQHNAIVGDRRWREVLDRHDEHVQQVVTDFGGRVVKGTGDGVLATFDGPARAIRCSDAIRRTLPGMGLHVRSGIHTGEIELRGGDIAGLAVTLASRIMATAGPSEIVVSRTVKDLVAGSGIGFADRGTHELKGIPDEWQLYAVESL